MTHLKRTMIRLFAIVIDGFAGPAPYHSSHLWLRALGMPPPYRGATRRTEDPR